MIPKLTKIYYIYHNTFFTEDHKKYVIQNSSHNKNCQYYLCCDEENIQHITNICHDCDFLNICLMPDLFVWDKMYNYVLVKNEQYISLQEKTDDSCYYDDNCIYFSGDMMNDVLKKIKILNGNNVKKK